MQSSTRYWSQARSSRNGGRRPSKMRDREAHPDSQYVALKNVRLCLRWNSPLLHEYIPNGWCYSTPHGVVLTESAAHAARTSRRPNPAPPANTAKSISEQSDREPYETR